MDENAEYMGGQVKLLSIEDAMGLDRKKVLETYRTYVNPGLANLMALLDMDIHFVKAQGTNVWDEDGNKYLDFVGGFGTLNLGHNHPAVLEALQKVAEISVPVMLQSALSKFAAVLGHNLVQVAPPGLQNCWFCSSGTEAVEGSLKLARIYSGKDNIIYTLGGFHGKTMGSLSVTGRKKYQEPFEPLIPGCIHIPYGDSAALEYALRENNAAAFIVEPVQGEGGIIPPPPGYLREVRELCSKYNTLLILDEIQTGMGRTGKMFACQHEDIVPDVLVLSKSLGGGVVPIGCYMTTAQIMKKAYGGGMDKGLMLTSTFGGNAHCAAAAIASLSVIVKENLPQKAEEKGRYFLHKLEELKSKHEIIKDVRGQGLLIGLEVVANKSLFDSLSAGLTGNTTSEFLSSMIAAELLKEHKVMVIFTLNNPNVIRLEPPLNVTIEEIDYVVDALDKLFSRHKSFLKIALKSGKNVISSIFKK